MTIIRDFIEIGGNRVNIGERKTIDLHLAHSYDYTELSMPVQVIRGKNPGPTLFLSGAVHGDELIGVAIIKKIINSRKMRALNGTLIAIPIVNVFGFNNRSRYLPDRRDLNRSFPGSFKGSLASQIAAIFTTEIIQKSQFGIDFHSGAMHRLNLPQVRTSIENPTNRELAEAFGVPVILDSKLKDGSLREAADELGISTLLFEGGEALRIDERVVKLGVSGALAVMEKIGMLPAPANKSPTQSYLANSSYWIRASQSGMIRFIKGLGSKVKQGMHLGTVSDAFGNNRSRVVAPSEGIIIGISNLPLVNKGDALFHIATFENSSIIKELAADLTHYDEHY